MPAISIIIPGYNAQMYLPHCLDSLIGQTLKDIEIIYIDTGSQDDTVRLVKEYAAADCRVKFRICRPIGTAYALNAGLDAASGTYIMFCEPDALYAPNMCEIMLKTIQKTHTDVVCCRIAPMYQLPSHRLEAIPTKGAENIEFKNYGRHRLNEKYRMIEGVIPWNKIWKGQLIEKYHIRFWARTGYEYDSF